MGTEDQQVFLSICKKSKYTNTNYSDHLSPSSGIAMWWQIHQVFANWQKNTNTQIPNTPLVTMISYCDAVTTDLPPHFKCSLSLSSLCLIFPNEVRDYEVLNWKILESRCWGKKRRCWETTSSSRSRRKCQASTFSWSHRSCTSLREARSWNAAQKETTSLREAKQDDSTSLSIQATS